METCGSYASGSNETSRLKNLDRVSSPFSNPLVGCWSGTSFARVPTPPLSPKAPAAFLVADNGLPCHRQLPTRLENGLDTTSKTGPWSNKPCMGPRRCILNFRTETGCGTRSSKMEPVDPVEPRWMRVFSSEMLKSQGPRVAFGAGSDDNSGAGPWRWGPVPAGLL